MIMYKYTHKYAYLHCTKNEFFHVFSVSVTKSTETADLVTFTEEILNGKLHRPF